MNLHRCTFFGHRDAPSEIKPILRKVIVDLIENQDIKRFYVGTHGKFDSMALALLEELEQSHIINYEIVLAYLPKKSESFDAYHTLLPEGIESVPSRFAIEYRNKWMIDHSDFVITYVNRSFGGASKFKNLARRKHKEIIEIAEIGGSH